MHFPILSSLIVLPVAGAALLLLLVAINLRALLKSLFT
jgi:hypothetical protein